MFVDFAGLRAGANTSYTAADSADQASGRLSRAGVGSGIFGEFAEARSFHRALSDAHTRHAQLANDHCTSLGSIGDKAHIATSEFADTEERNSAAVRDVYQT
ncbi:DUF2563 family protein [Mycolicibacterium palauense]|uniref:DUF2563 family protein n=1 Tax=Mycolicibacterium palauense TaxID=2034511 RepID=UPI000BFEAB0D|nr:DUF2563 family protein [Mycolicibacterium palauense]